MINVINKKTELAYRFTEEQWAEAKEKGLHKKFKIVSQFDGSKKSTTTYIPPELVAKDEKKEVEAQSEPKEEKPVVKKKNVKPETK